MARQDMVSYWQGENVFLLYFAAHITKYVLTFEYLFGICFHLSTHALVLCHGKDHMHSLMGQNQIFPHCSFPFSLLLRKFLLLHLNHNVRDLPPACPFSSCILRCQTTCHFCGFLLVMNVIGHFPVFGGLTSYCIVQYYVCNHSYLHVCINL